MMTSELVKHLERVHSGSARVENISKTTSSTGNTLREERKEG